MSSCKGALASLAKSSKRNYTVHPAKTGSCTFSRFVLAKRYKAKGRIRYVKGQQHQALPDGYFHREADVEGDLYLNDQHDGQEMLLDERAGIQPATDPVVWLRVRFSAPNP